MVISAGFFKQDTFCSWSAILQFDLMFAFMLVCMIALWGTVHMWSTRWQQQTHLTFQWNTTFAYQICWRWRIDVWEIPIAISVTVSQWPMSIDLETARADQVCMTLALVNALWSLARSMSVSNKCCLDLSLATAPATHFQRHLNLWNRLYWMYYHISSILTPVFCSFLTTVRSCLNLSSKETWWWTLSCIYDS